MELKTLDDRAATLLHSGAAALVVALLATLVCLFAIISDNGPLAFMFVPLVATAWYRVGRSHSPQ